MNLKTVLLMTMLSSSLVGRADPAKYVPSYTDGTTSPNNYVLFSSTGSIAESSLVVTYYSSTMSDNTNSPWGFYFYKDNTYTVFPSHSTGSSYNGTSSDKNAWYSSSYSWCYIANCGEIHPYDKTVSPTIMFTAPADGVYKVSLSWYRMQLMSTAAGDNPLYMHSRFMSSAQTSGTVNAEIFDDAYGSRTEDASQQTLHTEAYYVNMKSGDKVTFEISAPNGNGTANTQITDLSVTASDEATATAAAASDTTYYDLYTTGSDDAFSTLSAEITAAQALVGKCGQTGAQYSADDLSALESEITSAQELVDAKSAITLEINNTLAALKTAEANLQSSLYFVMTISGSRSIRLAGTKKFLTQNNPASTFYYAGFFDTDGVKKDANRFTSSGITVNDYDWTFTFTPTSDGIGYNITNANGYLTPDAYVVKGSDNNPSNNVLTLLVQNPGDSLFAVKRSDGKYWSNSIGWSSPYNKINTSSTPQYVFVLDNNVLTDTLDENGTFVPDSHGVGFLTLKRGLKLNSWNTICLPFTRSIDAITALFGSDSELATFAGGDDDVLNFTTGAVSLKANVPYLLKPTSMATDSLYTLQDVQLSGDGAGSVPTDNYSFMGTYSKEILPDVYYIYNNAFYHSTDEFTVTIKPFRCYFTAVNSSAKALSINIDGNGETTAIMQVTPDQPSAATGVYNLNGQCLRKGVSNVSGLPKGLYIINGKKVVVSH